MGAAMLVLHLDMDYFYAACEELRRPELKGKPLIVGTYGEKDRLKGVVQTCNYEARKYGIRSGMPTAKAFGLCKDLAYAAPDDAYYDEMSRKVMETLRARGFPMEIMSIDEAALDISELDYAQAEKLARGLKGEISSRFGLPCSIGIGTGKAFAKMACDAAKPNGILVVKEADLPGFLKGRDVGELPGAGKKTEERLKAMGIKTISDLAGSDPMVLMDEFGVAGKELYMLAHGTDDSKIVEHYEALSIGRERTLEKDAVRVDEILDFVKGLVHEVMEEVRARGFLFRNIGVKVRYADFTERIHSYTTNNYTDSEELVYSTALRLFEGLMTGARVRRVGVRVSRLMARRGQKRL
jgi:DNA polymerase IV (DinB-like DNA polymerase)